MFFSNEGFYRFCRQHLDSAPAIVRTILTGFEPEDEPSPRELGTVPYDYDIRKGTLDTRTLSVFHPAVQLQFVSLYDRFAHVILHLCRRSRFSLRYPATVASAVYGKLDDGDDDELKYGATYFKYEKYDLLYRFFDSYEFQRLEKRFRHLRMFDISKCFSHIYTHTLSWAVRSKEFAKKHIPHSSFDAEFDNIMQAANHRETAGILIGPEVSRIFAEIILQRVDAAVERRLAASDRKHGLDYDVRRYVDDYYVFSSSEDVGDEVMSAYHQELKQYRLDFNEAKSVSMVVPFMTSISCAKVELSDVLSKFFETLVSVAHDDDEDEGGDTARQLRVLRNPGRKANRLVQRIKTVMMSNGVEFASISGYLFAIIEKRLKAILKQTLSSDTNDEALQGFLFAILDATFFIYAMDVRVSTTYKAGRIAVAACKAVTGRSPATEELIKKKIYDESRRVLEAETRGNPELYVETVNLLAVVRILGEPYRVPVETITRMIESMDRDLPDGAARGVDYFLVTALLFHMANDPYYADAKTNLLAKVRGLFDTTDNTSKRADFTCLFLDLLRCPFVHRTFKRELVGRFRVRGRTLTRAEMAAVLRVCRAHQWFTNWLATDSIEVLLEKKRYTTPY